MHTRYTYTHMQHRLFNNDEKRKKKRYKKLRWIKRCTYETNAAVVPFFRSIAYLLPSGSWSSLSSEWSWSCCSSSFGAGTTPKLLFRWKNWSERSHSTLKYQSQVMYCWNWKIEQISRGKPIVVADFFPHLVEPGEVRAEEAPLEVSLP